ncbi:MAG: hypothetical protein QM710_12165 [Flavobacterium sp.]
MKIGLFFTVLIVNVFSMFSQNPLDGKWRIDYLIGYGGDKTTFLNEYVLSKPEEERTYGNSANFSGETFSSGYSAPCGNDCFPSSVGKLKMIDESHVSLQLDTIYIHGDCQTKHVKIDKSPVVYYIFKDEDAIRLIKSDGILANDLEKQQYSKIISRFESDPKNWSNLGNLPFYELKESYVTNEQALRGALSKIKNYTSGNEKILFSKPVRNNMFTVTLFEYNNKKALFVLYLQNICIIDL